MKTNNGIKKSAITFTQLFRCRGKQGRIETDLLLNFLYALGFERIQAKATAREITELLDDFYIGIIDRIWPYDWSKYDVAELLYTHNRIGFNAESTESARIALAKLNDGFLESVKVPSRELDGHLKKILDYLAMSSGLTYDYQFSEYGIGRDNSFQRCYYYKINLIFI